MGRGAIIAGVILLAAPSSVGAEAESQAVDTLVVVKPRPAPVSLIVVGRVVSTRYTPMALPAGMIAMDGFYTYRVRVSKVASGSERRRLITVHDVSDPAIRTNLALVFRLHRIRAGDYGLVGLGHATRHRRRPRG
jgi:hypothetical protein